MARPELVTASSACMPTRGSGLQLGWQHEARKDVMTAPAA